ncbi:MAG TPA: hypothetical protein VN256_13255 [Pyrinomonadaceae bacterium]|nr:hypothetical protein [Pyrinomonadaceae bacterium]
MLSKARQVIREALEAAESPAVLSSFGKDSMLLLTLAREVRPDIPVIWFRPENQKFAKRMILEMDLEAWSWEPSDVYVLPNENGLSLIREQSFGTQNFPVLLDVEHGDKCVGDVFPERTPVLFPHFDVLLIGYKESDYHWTLGGSGFCPGDGWQLGKAKVYAPLRSYTDEQVWAATKELNVPVDEERYFNDGPDPDTLSCCSRCLQAGAEKVFCPKAQVEIETVQWNPGESLRAFQERFGFRKAA